MFLYILTFTFPDSSGRTEDCEPNGSLNLVCLFYCHTRNNYYCILQRRPFFVSYSCRRLINWK
jgi:hypothetical protein